MIDRPLVGKLDSTKEYVQPQWIVDSLNNLFLLPTQPYRAGVPPPPHLSPFIDNSKEGYTPSRLKEINQLKGEVVDDDEELEDESESEEEKVVVPPKKAIEPKELPKKPVKELPNKQAKPELKAVSQGPAKGDADSSSDEEDSEDDANKQKKLKQIKNQKLKKELQKEQEELGKILMSKKQR